jgi:hypothetical protein
MDLLEKCQFFFPLSCANIKEKLRQVLVVHVCNPTSQESEVGKITLIETSLPAWDRKFMRPPSPSIVGCNGISLPPQLL